ncbi:MAG: hypothetical protein AAB116_17480 [Candidatus Poribacteria bacterium]
MKTLEIKRPSEKILSQVQSLTDERGKVAAIEPDTGEWFLGKDALEAFNKARSKYPQSIFYFIKIGYPSIYSHKGHIKGI